MPKPTDYSTSYSKAFSNNTATLSPNWLLTSQTPQQQQPLHHHQSPVCGVQPAGPQQQQQVSSPALTYTEPYIGGPQLCPQCCQPVYPAGGPCQQLPASTTTSTSTSLGRLQIQVRDGHASPTLYTYTTSIHHVTLTDHDKGT